MARLLCEHCGKIRTATTPSSRIFPCPACLDCNSPAKIRKLRPDIPVILTSGYLNPDDLNRAGQLAIRTILLKPVNTKELLGALADLFEKRAELQRN
jgi:DNA-binding NarL/FixJ family response regulator